MPMWHDRQLGGFDLETTGLDGEHDCVVQWSFQLDGGGTGQLDRDATEFCDPGIPIPNTDKHGITDEMVRGAKSEAESLKRLIVFLEWAADSQTPVCAMNARFDVTFLKQRCEKFYLPTAWADEVNLIDPFILDKQTDKFRRGKRTLGAMCDLWGIDYSDDPAARGLHDAGYDAKLTIKVARELGRRRRYNGELLGAVHPDDLHDLQARWHDELARSLAEYWRGKGDARFREVRLGWPVQRGPVFGSA